MRWLLASLVLLMAFFGVVSWHPSPSWARTRVIATRAQLASFETALVAYQSDTGAFPSTEMGLEALRIKPPGVAHWDGPYLPEDIPLDPWGNLYIYKFPGPRPNEPGILSLGADGRPGGEGIDADIMSWKN